MIWAKYKYLELLATCATITVRYLFIYYFDAFFNLFDFVLQLKSDAGRLAYLKSNGLSHLFESCRYCTSVDLTSCSEEERKNKITLITVILGCLHNVTNENGIFIIIWY